MAFDTDRSGFLTADELVGVLMREGSGQPLTMQEAKMFVSYFDKNNDGQLSIEEFAGALGQPVIFGGVPCGSWNTAENMMGSAAAEAVPMAENVTEFLLVTWVPKPKCICICILLTY